MGLDRWYSKVLSDDFLFEIGMGRVGNHFSILKFGESEAIGATETLIYDAISAGAPLVIPYLPDAQEETFTLESDDTGDSYSLGTGAMAVRVFGLTGTGVWQVEDVPLNGTTPVSTQGKYWRIFRMFVIKSAARSGQLGTITAIYNSTVYAAIIQASGRIVNTTNMLTFTVPKGYTAGLLEAHLFAGQTKAIDFSLIIRELGGAARLQRRAKEILATSVHWDYKIPASYSELTDIEVRGVVGTPPGTSVSGDFALVLSKNNNDVVSLSGSPTIGDDLS